VDWKERPEDMDTFTKARVAQSKKVGAATGRGAPVPAGLVGAGISLIVVVGLIHLINSPGDLQEGSYTGVLYLANFVGALAAAVGIYRGKGWGWALGLLVAAGAFAGYVISRTVGLPGLPVETEWLEPLGVLSLVVEGLFVGVFLVVLARPKEERRALEASTSAGSSG
jgi:hypothetical protein